MEPCYTRTRPYEPTQRAADGNYYCKQCNALLSGRRTAYCSRACEDLYRIPRDWNFARHLARRRDKYKCVRCAARGTHEVDHILPVSEGGGGCGLDNLRTLCVCCHRHETRKLAARRAEQRKGAR